MLDSKIAQKIAQELPGVSGKDHFGGDGFYVNKKIFATVWHNKNEVNVRLNPEQQRAFVEKDGQAFAAVPNAFGRQGWTTIMLKFANRKLFKEALTAAWEHAALKVSRASPSKKRTPRKSRAVRQTPRKPRKI